jgi:hypothetical protein
VVLTAHQQCPAVRTLLQVVAVGPLNLDGAQPLEAEQGQDGAVTE